MLLVAKHFLDRCGAGHRWSDPSFATDFEGVSLQKSLHRPSGTIGLLLAKWRIIDSQEATWKRKRSPRC